MKLLILTVFLGAAFSANAQSNDPFASTWNCKFNSASLYQCVKGSCGKGLGEIEEITLNFKDKSANIDGTYHRMKIVASSKDQKRFSINRDGTIIFGSAGMAPPSKAISLISVGQGQELAYHHGWTECS